MATFKQNLKTASDSIGTAMAALTAADGGDKTGVAQTTQDEVNDIVVENEGVGEGTLAGIKASIDELTATIPDAPDPMAAANQTMQS